MADRARGGAGEVPSAKQIEQGIAKQAIGIKEKGKAVIKKNLNDARSAESKIKEED